MAINSICGLELSQRYYKEAVRPILLRHFPRLQHSAALIGPGSEVLGCDDAMSRDHHWGPRLLLFVGEGELRRIRRPVSQCLSRELPREFLGFSTNFGPADEIGVRLMKPAVDGPIMHMVEVHSVRRWFKERLGFDATGPIAAKAWINCPQQRLLEVTSGGIFHDGLRQLNPLRRRLAYFPRDVWLHLMAAKWEELGQEEAFVGRTGLLGDDLGSRLIASRQVSRMIELCFLIERRYAPYSKWFATAFNQLRSAGRMGPLLEEALSEADWQSREAALCRAAEQLVRMHNRLAVTEPVKAEASPFFDRPFSVIHAQKIASLIRHRCPPARRA